MIRGNTHKKKYGTKQCIEYDPNFHVKMGGGRIRVCDSIEILLKREIKIRKQRLLSGKLCSHKMIESTTLKFWLSF